MTITITVLSILTVSALVWFVNRILPFTVCPICAGVFLTWVGLVGAHFLGYQINLIIPALLMGGSVVGIAYQLEKKFRDLPVGKILLWKILFIPGGLVAAYSILEQLPAVFLIAVVFLLLVSLLLLSNANKRSETVIGLEKEMKDCC
ncbi:hypothetical protein A3A36_00430 [Candidatus Kaiserbacteria bacterium RIFCSPLOWO2_01_FULL_52_12b]|uniref:Uncharacterized protein n=1 Tax=Candidatus Kaiserbacteria bacterium RIFCSPLOWO2_01_FULL_52_12b TaxID=1798509 RepID=A0A1F6EY93_9BACT|nr:MAG: hypothetical protein A3A36_00430 [Candidatus Kaiserbacteria bacterium RIFCSPLOWO2_01_FULL_52_12b]